MAALIPISTVYVQNLEERVKLETLLEALKILFSEYGAVVDIVAKKRLRARGQAFIVFDRPEDAENAMSNMQGFQLFGKPMKTAMARTSSDKSVQMKGTNDDFAMHKKHRQEEKVKRQALEDADGQERLRGQTRGSEKRIGRTTKAAGVKSTNGMTSTVIPDEYLPPNKILFLQNVPDEYDVDALTALFGRFEGLIEVRVVPTRRGIAFVEYEAESGAIAAKESISGMTLGDKVIKVTYQRQ